MLTATSDQARNYRYDLSLGQTGAPPEAGTAEALARQVGVDAPVIAATPALVAGRLGVQEATRMLMRRPLRRE